MKVTLLFGVLLAAMALTSAQVSSPAEASEEVSPVIQDLAEDGADLDGAETFFFNKFFRPRYSYGRSFYRPRYTRRRSYYRPRYNYRSYGGYW